MTRHRRLLSALAVGAASLLLLTACATNARPAGAGLGSVSPEPPAGTVVAQGTVMDTGDSIELCLGAIAESYPPQCSGLPLEGWTWDGVEGSETASGITWGAYAVQGTFDGETFTVTEPPVMLALYDPMPLPDPTDGEPGAASEEQLTELQDELPERLGDAYLMSYPENSRLWVDVVWDDGTLQDAANSEYGAEVVVIRSALREVG